MAPTRHRAWLAAAGVIAVLLVLSFWGGSRQTPPAGRSLAVAPVAPNSVDASPRPAEAGVPAPAASAPVHGPNELEVCGGGWIEMPPNGLIDPAEIERLTGSRKVREAILAKLDNEPGAYGRAAGLLLRSAEKRDAYRWAVLSLPDMSCGKDDACAALQQAAEAEAERTRDAIARTALAEPDAKLYALAINTCGQRADGACRLLNGRQWVRLDPGNAVPWLHLLDEARAANDGPAQEEALSQIATATRSEVGPFDLVGAVLGVVPHDDDASAIASFSMVTSAFGIEAAWGMPGYQVVSRLCAVDALRDANRRQLCAGVAEVLAEHSDALLGRSIGAAIGLRTGWSAERRDRMRGEYNAYLASLASADETPVLGCAYIRRELAGIAKRVRLGEVGALRDWVAASGKRPEDFVRAEHAREQRSQLLAAQAAASAASTAPARSGASSASASAP